jgi:mannose-6-phosphate isomerase-like protein (cupin superfamily)
MSKSIIETYYHDGEGYNPFFIRDHWQVAQLNYLPELGMQSIKKMEMHISTDEIFILIKGTAVLILGIENREGFNFELVKMKIGVTYNIPIRAWHGIAMDTDAEIIIVEKSNTHLGDVTYQNLSQEEQKKLNEAITRLL